MDYGACELVKSGREDGFMTEKLGLRRGGLDLLCHFNFF
jgi:hypothetical protein